MKNLKLSSKAKTLEDLKPIITSAKVLAIFRFHAIEYKNNKVKIINSIRLKFDSNLIIRSSSSNEDNLQTSHAGGFDSVLNVPSKEVKAIDAAVTQVIQSYEELTSKDEVFVQPMLENVLISGVAFSSDISNLTPYYIINYDDITGLTNTITSGSSNYSNKNLSHIYREYMKSVVFTRDSNL